jgi:hypothetical protein
MRTTIPHAVYNNVKEDIQQQQYVFDTLWNNATPAEQRIKEIEEGVQPASTRILQDQDQIINEIRRLNYRSAKLSICSAYGGMQMSYKYFFDSYMNLVDKHQKGEGKPVMKIIHDNGETFGVIILCKD